MVVNDSKISQKMKKKAGPVQKKMLEDEKKRVIIIIRNYFHFQKLVFPQRVKNRVFLA